MTAPVREGDVLAGKYRVEKVLGEGGMGVVVAATHLQLEQRVALKFLLPEALESPEIVHRFAREARAAARIKTEHVARVSDVGELESGAPFMVMEYLEGKDLEQILETRGALPPAEAVSYVVQALEAVAEAHGAGIIHRDLKPANLFLARRPDQTSIIKVLDFGISKSLDPATANLTSTSSILGSPHYMSPEQLSSSKNVDARGDIWAVGTILYQLLTNRFAFPGESMPQIVAAILQNDPEPIAKLRPEVPADLRAIVARCLATDPKHRYAHVGELAAALAPHLADSDHEGRAAVEAVGRLTGAVAHAATHRPPSPSAGDAAPSTTPTGLAPRTQLAGPAGTLVANPGTPAAAALPPPAPTSTLVAAGGAPQGPALATQAPVVSRTDPNGARPEGGGASRTTKGLLAAAALVVGFGGAAWLTRGDGSGTGDSARGAAGPPPPTAATVARSAPVSDPRVMAPADTDSARTVEPPDAGPAPLATPAPTKLGRDTAKNDSPRSPPKTSPPTAGASENKGRLHMELK